MLELLAFIACVWLVIYVYIKLKRRFFNRFIDAKSHRVLIWNWTKRVFLIACSIILTIKGIECWVYFHDEIAYTNKKFLDMAYADQIEMEAYFMNNEKLISLFENNHPDPIPEFTNENNLQETDPNFYLVIRIKNKGDRILWGSIAKKPNGPYIPYYDIPPIGPNMTDFTNIVLWYRRADKYLPMKYQQVEVRWDKIYTSTGENL